MLITPPICILCHPQTPLPRLGRSGTLCARGIFNRGWSCGGCGVAFLYRCWCRRLADGACGVTLLLCFAEGYLYLALAEVTASIFVIFFTGFGDVDGLCCCGVAQTQKQKQKAILLRSSAATCRAWAGRVVCIRSEVKNKARHDILFVMSKRARSLNIQKS